MKNLGLISVILLVSIAGALALFVSLLQAKELPREVVIVAENMSYTVSSQNMQRIKNPTLNFNRGEEISILFRNNDPGIRHDLIIEGLDIKTSIIISIATIIFEVKYFRITTTGKRIIICVIIIIYVWFWSLGCTSIT